MVLLPEFVDAIPGSLDEGRLYISIRYRTATHLCACGCGTKVVTPIKPPRWHVTYDGETVTLWPSIGRWQLPCRSHYWIRRNEVIWSRPWTETEIAEGRLLDAEDLHNYYANRRSHEPPVTGVSDETKPAGATTRPRFLDRLGHLFRR
jgi:hypothetical protein